MGFQGGDQWYGAHIVLSFCMNDDTKQDKPSTPIIFHFSHQFHPCSIVCAHANKERGFISYRPHATERAPPVALYALVGMGLRLSTQLLYSAEAIPTITEVGPWTDLWLRCRSSSS